MDSNFKKCLDSLSDNETEIRSDALRILSRICDNVISFPNDNDYRKIRVDDSTIAEKLLTAYGAIECLFEMGFIEDGEYFTLPLDAPLSRLRQIQKALHDLQTKVSTHVTNVKNQQSVKRPKIHQRENFLDRIVDKFRHILVYENPQLQNKARRVIPLEKLQIGATERMRQLQKDIKTRKSNESSESIKSENQVTMEDFLLVELLDWFKNEFFTWMDSPSCNVCGKTCKYERVERSTDVRISRTEIHKCLDCGIEAKFPRYTDPGILLKTRRGRCGEWANAFTLICRALDFDARVVHDETDHVWTEVWSIASNRWIHADPCENAIDRPLLYELGWKKKLTYVIAYSRDEIQDCTWRYTRNQPAVMKRRVLCTEQDLCALICRLNDERQSSALGYSEARKRFVTKRRAMELVELMPAPPGTKKPGENDTDDDYEGRSSGSLAWRTSRGENRLPGTSFEPRIWKIPSDTEKLEIRYYSARDEYETLTSNGKILEKLKGWQCGIEITEGQIFRKVENDWKIAYLARSPGQTSGRVTWCIEIIESQRRIKLFRLRAKCANFHDGTIRWIVEGTHRDIDKKNIVLPIDNCENFQTKLLNDSTRITLIAELSGGKGDEAWQHAQLFRQSLTDRDDCTLTISIETRECENYEKLYNLTEARIRNII